MFCFMAYIVLHVDNRCREKARKKGREKGSRGEVIVV